MRALAVLARWRCNIALCDGLVSVHSLDSLERLCTLNSAQARAEAFAVNVEEALPRVVLAASCLNAFLFYKLANPVQLYREIPLRVPPAQMVWQGELLSLATAGGVRTVDASVGHTVFEHEGGGAAGEKVRLRGIHENQRWLPVRGYRTEHWSDEARRKASTPPCRPAALLPCRPAAPLPHCPAALWSDEARRKASTAPAPPPALAATPLYRRLASPPSPPHPTPRRGRGAGSAAWISPV